MSVSKVCLGAVLTILGFCGSQVSYAQNTISQSDFASKDCSGSVPTGYTRIFIAARSDGKPGTGSPSDPFDGSAAEKFDAVIRGRSESGVTQLIVCIGPGTFQTEGTGDYLIGQGHLYPSNPTGFTVNRGWRVHGAAQDRTTLRLIDLAKYPNGKLLEGIIIGTYNFDSSGVEVSDLTVDDNYPALKARYKSDLELIAVMLRSSNGHQWIHNIHAMNASGEGPEDFPVGITSQSPTPANEGNVIEYVTMDHWFGGLCTAIVIAGGSGEIRHNTVTGYHIGYGGWSMSSVNFHDNTAIETDYGFNIDSYQNSKITIAFNLIVRPKLYGIVVGGAGDFSDFSIHDNTIKAGPNTANGLVFQGNVRTAHVLRNKVIVDRSTGGSNAIGFLEKNSKNVNNVFQENVMTGAFKNSLQGADCLWGNVSETGQQLQSLSNTQNARCQADQ